MDTIPLMYDNTSSLNMAKNLVQHKRIKHIDIRHYFLRDQVENDNIYMMFCSTEDQISDIFTKPLYRDQSKKNRMRMGLLKLSRYHHNGEISLIFG